VAWTNVQEEFRKRFIELLQVELGCDGMPNKPAIPIDLPPKIRLSIHPKSHPDVLEQLNWFEIRVSKRGATSQIKVTDLLGE
jgi:hypothetical protein